MRIRSTHPPSAERAQHYRRRGYWSVVGEPGPLDVVRGGGGRIALVDDDSAWTYRQLAAAVAAVQFALLDAGVTRDDAVLVVTPLRNAAVAAYLAIVDLGAVAVMVDRRCGRADVDTACVGARPRFGLAFEADAAALGLSEHVKVLTLDDIESGGVVRHRAHAPSPPDPDLPAVVLFTSGTSSEPKGAIHTLNSLRCSAAYLAGALKLTSDDAFYLASPLASIAGILQLEATISLHAKLVLEDRFSADRALDRVCYHGATLIGGAPSIVDSLFAECRLQNRDRLPLRCVALGGAMIPEATIAAAMHFGIEVVRAYGSTEVPYSTSSTYGDRVIADDGLPLPGVEISVSSSGQEGELMVRGPHQFHGYVDPEHNTDVFVEDWVRTSDLARIDMGRLTVKGRMKEVAVRKGAKISLAEVELAAAELGECVAIALPDAQTGERVALAIRTGSTTGLSYTVMVDRLVRGGLAKWKLPEQIILWRGEFPRTPTGKIVRRKVVEDSSNHRSFLAPRCQSSYGDQCP